MDKVGGDHQHELGSMGRIGKVSLCTLSVCPCGFGNQQGKNLWGAAAQGLLNWEQVGCLIVRGNMGLSVGLQQVERSLTLVQVKP